MFLTNNSSKSVDKYIEKLAKLGIESTKEDFLTSTNATIVHLKKKNYHKIYGFGTATFRQQLMEAGLPITDKLEDDIDCLCMGFDTELTFKKLEDVSKLLLTRENIPYIATNPDYVCPTEFGSVPDCGSVCDMIYNATKRRPLVIGKPAALMPELAMQKFGYHKEETVVVGDRIYTDIKSGINAGTYTILVLSGETTEEILNASEEKPHLVLRDAGEIISML
jgi:HAD superfamily hydrolase (TIGR01450 family)